MLFRSRTSRTLLLYVAATTVFSLPARAGTGFTGNFDPSQDWVFAINGTPTAPGDCADFPLDASNCLFVVNDSASIGLSNIEGPALLTWTWTNKPEYGATYYISFDWAVGGEESNSTASFSIAGADSPTYSSGEFGQVMNERVLTNQTIQFRLEVVDGTSLPIDFAITNFNASVPAPLPAAGAASAFGFTRRLRRRCRGEGRAIAKRRAPAPPSTYLANQLNLPAASLAELPLSFSYDTKVVPAPASKTAA